MANEQALRDGNYVTTIIAVDDVTGETRNLITDSDGNLLIAASISAATVPDGGTGRTSFTAYAPIFGGTTSTSALQSGTVGTSGQVLTSNGAGALPTFQPAAAAGGTVTSVSVTTANGVSGVVATATTTPAITLTLGDITPSKVNGLTITSSTGTLTIAAAKVLTANNTLTLAGTDGKTLTVNKTLTLDGTDGTTITFPSTSATVARTDSANTFTGASTASAWVLTSPTITTKVSPTSDDGAPLGDTTHNFADLFLATGAVINYQNGNVAITHSSGILTMGTGELRITTPGTNSASVATIGSTNTFTNKRITRRLTTTNVPGATPTTNTDNVDVMNFTGLGTAITSMTTNLSGTPVDGDLIEFRFTDDGTPRGVTWGASFAATTVALPTTTVTSTMLRVLFEFQGSTWQCLAVA